MPRRTWTSLAVAAIIAGHAHGASAQPRVLVLTRTEGFPHDSIPAAIAATQAIAAERGLVVDATEETTAFTAAGLAAYDAVVFLSTTGDVLDAPEEDALRAYVEGGGGFLGVHSAADTELTSDFYRELLGARFARHPAVQPATVHVLDPVHPAMSALPSVWTREDEWYDFDASPRGAVHVVASVVESSYTGGGMGHDHPIAWCRDVGMGRSFYTALGHTEESWAEPLFLAHVAGALDWVTGAAEGDCRATLDSSFDEVVVADRLTQPTQMGIASDGRVFIAEIGGTVKVYDPTTGATTTAGQLEVWNANEGGLLGLAVDPAFAETGWIYLYYSPAAGSENRLSRFDVVSGAIDLASERIVLRVPTDRDRCCHHAGGLAVGPDGSLYVSTGNNTDPFESQGYAESDERPGRAFWDAQRTSASTHDLRGKILRIHPEPDGTYTIPAGNLFPADGTLGLPEIYAMGLKNAFRIQVDPATGWLYVGEVGPDAHVDDPARGPRGYDEVNQLRGPANLGWPYCVADNRPYRDYDFATMTSGPPHDCAAPVNDSPNNTGRRDLPPAMPAWIWYPYAESPEFPEITVAAGRTAMAGPVVHWAAGGVPTRLPRYYDGVFFFWDWARLHVYEVRLGDEGEPFALRRFIPSYEWRHPMDMRFAPDGSLYALMWGEGWAPIELGTLVRIDYTGGERGPAVRVAADRTSGPLPLEVRFTSEGTVDPEGGALTLAWDLDADGLVDASGAETTFVYDRAGAYAARLTATSASGRSASATVRIVAGNTAPVLTFETPAEDHAYEQGGHVAFRVRVVDAEDGTSDDCDLCAAVRVASELGHDAHTHPIDVIESCEGSIQIDVSHDGAAELFWILRATYTDRGGPDGAPPLTSTATRRLLPRDHREAGPVVSTAEPEPPPGGYRCRPPLEVGGGGCGCSVARASPPGGALATLLLALFCTRRRSR